MLGAYFNANDAAANQPHHSGRAGDDRPGHDAGRSPDRGRRRLPDCAAFLQHGGGLGSSAWLLVQTGCSSRGDLSLAGDEVVVARRVMKRMAWIASFRRCSANPYLGWPFSPSPLLDVEQRTAHPLRIGQVVPPDPPAEPAPPPAPVAPPAKRGPAGPRAARIATRPRRTLAVLELHPDPAEQAVQASAGDNLARQLRRARRRIRQQLCVANGAALPIRLISKLAVGFPLFFCYDGLYGARDRTRSMVIRSTCSPAHV